MALTNVMTQSLISASTSMKQIQLQQGVKKQMDGKAGVLDAEIKRDEASGADTTKKKEELAETQKRSEDIANNNMEQIAETNKEMQKAREADATLQKENERAEAAREKKKTERKQQEQHLQEAASERRAEEADRVANAQASASGFSDEENAKAQQIDVGGVKVSVVSESTHNTKVPHIDEKIAKSTGTEVSAAEGVSVSIDVKT